MWVVQPAEVEAVFSALTSNAGLCIFWMIITCILGFGVCALGLKNGVEKITKFMMFCLFIILTALVIRAVTLPNALEGISFYLLPNLDLIFKNGLWSTIYAAMGQAFFILSVGMGSMAIFGSCVLKERRLFGEGLNITILDTFSKQITVLSHLFSAYYHFDRFYLWIYRKICLVTL